MKDTTRAKEAKNGALKRIRDNIEKIYDDFIVNDKLYTLRISCCIKDDLYSKNKEAVSEMEDLEKLISTLDKERLKQIREDDKNATTDERIAKVNILIENYEKERAKEIGIFWPTQKKFKIQDDVFLKDAIKSIMRGAAPIFQRINIDPDLWRSVIAAILLRIPIEKTLEFEEFILNKYFLPIIYDNCLVIRFNELTKPGDLNIIWDLVEAKQAAYVAKWGYVNSITEYPSRKADRIITNSYRKGFNLDEIHAELVREKITKKYDKEEIRDRIEEYLRQTRQPAEKLNLACL